MTQDPCPANIGPTGARRRALVGLAMLAVAVGCAFSGVVDGLLGGWGRVLLCVPLIAAFLGFFQARKKT
jgi:hypothetical protein